MEITTWDKRNCPLCGSNKHSNSPESHSTRRAENLSWQEVKDLFVGLRSEQVFFSYYRCTNCSLLYCPWYFNADQLEILYSEMPDNLMGEDKSVVSRTQSGYVTWLKMRNVNATKYIEIGPDIGLVAHEVDKQFNVSEAFLVEPNLGVHTELARSMPKADYVKVVEYPNKLENSNASLIIGIHVYDHLLNPVEDLKELTTKAASDSKLAVVVHNEDSILRKLMKKSWPPFCLQHPQLYNETTLKYILEKSGWDFRELGKTTNWYKARHFTKLGLEVLGLPSWISRLVPNLELPVRLGNIIAIASRKYEL